MGRRRKGGALVFGGGTVAIESEVLQDRLEECLTTLRIVTASNYVAATIVSMECLWHFVVVIVSPKAAPYNGEDL